MASKIVSFFTAAALTMTCSYSSMASMDTGYFTVSSEQTPTCMEAVTPPVLDGNMDPIWDTAPVFEIPNICGSTYNGLSGSYFKLLWDEEALYLFVDVKDTTRRPGDQVGVFFRELDVGQAASQLLQVSFPRTDTVAQIAYEQTDTVYYVQEKATGYALEWRLPRRRGNATVKESPYSAGDRFQINITVDDDVNAALPGREYYISYLKPASTPTKPAADEYVWWYVNGVVKSQLPAITLASGNAAIAMETKRPILMDGVIDDTWKQTPAHAMAYLDIDVPNQVQGSYFKVLWDADHLYFLVDVKDKTPRAADQVAIFFREMDLEQKGTRMLQVPFPRNGAVTTIAYENTSTSYAIQEYASGYILEWVLPRQRGDSTVCADPYVSGRKIQVNVTINDDCDAKAGREYYASYLKPTSSPNRMKENEYLWWYMANTEKSRLPAIELWSSDTSPDRSVHKAIGEPVVDGIIEPAWMMAEPYALTYMVGNGTNKLQDSYFKLLWDESALYILVYARDTSPRDADQVGVYFREMDGTQAEVRLLQALFPRNGTTSTIAYENTPVSYAVEECDDGYVFEWKIPRLRGENTVKDTPYALGDKFQINVAISDDQNDTAGREYYVSHLKPAGNPYQPAADEYLWWYVSDTEKSRFPAFTLTPGVSGSLQRIIIPENATETEQTAAQELQVHLRKCLEVQLPIYSDSIPPVDGELQIGRTNREGNSSASGRPPLGNDGYFIGRHSNTIRITGDADRGTLYGVYAFLELFFGCRWYSSQVIKTPRISARHMQIPANLQLVDIPVLEYRNADWFDTYDAATAARLRINCAHNRHKDNSLPYGGVMNYAGGSGMYCHTFGTLMPPDTYFSSHPEYYSLNVVNGQKVRTTKQLCLTNPQVLQIVIQKVRTILAADPSANIISVSQNDVVAPCICDNCARIDSAEGSQSGTMIRFVNAVAAAIQDEYPHVKVDTLAYFYSSVPPKLTAPRDNVIVRLATARNCCVHPFESDTGHEATQAFQTKLAGWKQLCQNIYIWDYTTDFGAYLMTFPNLRTLGPNLRYLVQNNVKGLTAQGNFQDDNGEFGELRVYLLSKLMWNPYIDENAVIFDFLQGYYGDGWREILRYIDEFHDATQDHHVLSTIQNAATDVLPVVSRAQTEEFIRRMEVFWNNALCEADALSFPQVERSSLQLLFYKQVVTRPWYYEGGTSLQKQQWLAENQRLFTTMKARGVDVIRENIRLGNTVDLTLSPDKWR